MWHNTNDMTPTASQIGEWLKRKRVKAGIARERAAPLARTTTRTLARWEDGEVAPPSDQFFALVLLYEADILELLATKSTRGSTAGAASESGDKPARKTG